MELKLENGRYVPSKYLGLERVGGADELLQRVSMKLQVRRGSFYPLPDYGSRLYTLSSIKPSLRETAAKQFIQEALSDETGLNLDSVEITYHDEDNITIAAEFTYEGDVKLFIDTKI